MKFPSAPESTKAEQERDKRSHDRVTEISVRAPTDGVVEEELLARTPLFTSEQGLLTDTLPQHDLLRPLHWLRRRQGGKGRPRRRVRNVLRSHLGGAPGPAPKVKALIKADGKIGRATGVDLVLDFCRRPV